MPDMPNIKEIRLAICATRGGWIRRRAHELLNCWHSLSESEREKAVAAVNAWTPEERKLMESKLAPLESLEPKVGTRPPAEATNGAGKKQDPKAAGAGQAEKSTAAAGQAK